MSVQTISSSSTLSDQGRYRLGIDQIRRYLPHRQPFLLVDRILDIEPMGDLSSPVASADKVGTKVHALKNISYNEPCFQGHFPEFSIFPGVFLIEAMGQAASFALYPYIAHDLDRLMKGFQIILVGVNNCRFRKPVVPGDSVHIEAKVTRCRERLWVFDVQAVVEGQKVCEAELMANLMIKKD